MAEEIVRLTASDYDEWLSLLNYTFTVAHHNVPMHFEKSLPKMCKRDDEHMNMHLGLKRDGRLRAVVGIYPLPAVVADEQLMFSTMGNVATLPEETGKGYMSQLLNAAQSELERIKADASRLGGKRSRYRRYRFDFAGSLHTYLLDLEQMCSEIMIPRSLTFVPLTLNDRSLIEQARLLHQSKPFKVLRTNQEDFYDSLTAWENVPFAVLDDRGIFIGYLCASADGKSIAELGSVSFQAFQRIILGWLNQKSAQTTISLMPHYWKENLFLEKICINSQVSAPCQFKIIHWEKIIFAFLKLKSSYVELPHFSKMIELKGYGKLFVRTSPETIECVRADHMTRETDVSVTWDEANTLFFGPSPIMAESLGCGAVFPLPLSWNLQDRV